MRKQKYFWSPCMELTRSSKETGLPEPDQNSPERLSWRTSKVSKLQVLIVKTAMGWILGAPARFPKSSLGESDPQQAQNHGVRNLKLVLVWVDFNPEQWAQGGDIEPQPFPWVSQPCEMAASFPSHFQTLKCLFVLNPADHENSFSLLTFLKYEGFKGNQQQSVSFVVPCPDG